MKRAPSIRVIKGDAPARPGGYRELTPDEKAGITELTGKGVLVAYANDEHWLAGWAKVQFDDEPNTLLHRLNFINLETGDMLYPGQFEMVLQAKGNPKQEGLLAHLIHKNKIFGKLNYAEIKRLAKRDLRGEAANYATH